MPSSWDVLALCEDPGLSGHRCLRLPLENPQNFWYLLLYLLTFLDHHCISIYRLLLMSASSCTQVIFPEGLM